MNVSDKIEWCRVLSECGSMGEWQNGSMNVIEWCRVLSVPSPDVFGWDVIEVVTSPLWMRYSLLHTLLLRLVYTQKQRHHYLQTQKHHHHCCNRHCIHIKKWMNLYHAHIKL